MPRDVSRSLCGGGGRLTEAGCSQMNLHVRPIIGLAPRCRLVSVDKDAVPLMQVMSSGWFAAYVMWRGGDGRFGKARRAFVGGACICWFIAVGGRGCFPAHFNEEAVGCR